jgi:hypothetical protein
MVGAGMCVLQFSGTMSNGDGERFRKLFQFLFVAV